VTFPTVANETHAGPTWSADGTKIVFARGEFDEFNTHIVTVNRDGTNLSEVLASNGVDSWIELGSWAPNGQIIYVDKHTAAGECLGFITIMNADGSGSMALTGDLSCSTYYPRFSLDGTQIVFTSDLAGGGSFDIYIMDADGSNITNLTDGAFSDPFSAAWSPDGTSIVFNVRGLIGEDRGIWLMDADGTNQTKLTDGIDDWGPAWRTLP